MNKISIENLSYGEMKFHFLNGSITLPSENGGYVIASGCGSGKTTIIKELIRTRFNEGILYSASTIKECNEMYDYCMSILGTTITDDVGRSFTLTVDRILTIHSDPRLDEEGRVTNGVNTSLWKNHPEKVHDMYVVICTHVKLLNESPKILFPVSFIKNRRMNSIELSLGTGMPTNNPRKWVLIDELPTCEMLSKTFNINTILLLGRVITGSKVTGYDENGDEIVDYITIINRIEDYDIFKMRYHEACKSDPSLRIADTSTEAGRLKEDNLLSSLHANYDKFSRGKDTIKLTYNISDLIIKGNFKSKLILFDGTGDLTQINSRKFTVLSYPNKYNSPIKIYQFENHINRTITIDSKQVESGFNYKKDIYEGIEKNVDELSDIISRNNKTLIVTWKNFKSGFDKVKVGGKLSMYSEIMNDEFNLPEYYKYKLDGRCLGKEYSIIHYMSGLDKATNEYKDYDAVVFLGKFSVPNAAIKDFNDTYGCSTDLKNFTTYQLVQAVCRTRIRNHKGEEVRIYFSNDWDESNVHYLREYIENDIIKSKPIENTSYINIKPKWRTVAEILGNYDKEFDSAIRNNYKYELNIPLDIIFPLIPMSDKRVQRYYPMINYFRKLGIEINIESTDTKFSSKYNPRN